MSSDFIMDQKLANWRDVRQAVGLSGRSPQAGSYLRNFGTNLRGAFAPARWTKFGAPLPRVRMSAFGGKADIDRTLCGVRPVAGQIDGFGHSELWLRNFVPAKCTLSPENVLTTADLLPVLAAPTLGLVVKGALEAFFGLQLQCM
jgi:hypothetical protein